MRELKEIKSRPFVFFKITVNQLAADCQAPQAGPKTKACQSAVIHTNFYLCIFVVYSESIFFIGYNYE